MSNKPHNTDDGTFKKVGLPIIEAALFAVLLKQNTPPSGAPQIAQHHSSPDSTIQVIEVRGTSAGNVNDPEVPETNRELTITMAENNESLTLLLPKKGSMAPPAQDDDKWWLELIEGSDSTKAAKIDGWLHGPREQVIRPFIWTGISFTDKVKDLADLEGRLIRWTNRERFPVLVPAWMTHQPDPEKDRDAKFIEAVAKISPSNLSWLREARQKIDHEGKIIEVRFYKEKPDVDLLLWDIPEWRKSIKSIKSNRKIPDPLKEQVPAALAALETAVSAGNIVDLKRLEDPLESLEFLLSIGSAFDPCVRDAARKTLGASILAAKRLLEVNTSPKWPGRARTGEYLAKAEKL